MSAEHIYTLAAFAAMLVGYGLLLWALRLLRRALSDVTLTLDLLTAAIDLHDARSAQVAQPDRCAA